VKIGRSSESDIEWTKGLHQRATESVLHVQCWGRGVEAPSFMRGSAYWQGEGYRESGSAYEAHKTWSKGAYQGSM